MIELQLHKFPSTNVHSIGFEPLEKGRGNLYVQFKDKGGNLYVQFKDKGGNLTVLGFYKDVQRAIFNGLENDRKPGVFISQNLKGRFEWEVTSTTHAAEEIDRTLPDEIYIPPDCPNTVEAIAMCIDAQRIEVERKGLFE